MKCVICKQNIDILYHNGKAIWEDGHNAEPICEGRCCTICNDTVVMPQRITDMQMSLLEGGIDG